jgi:hypothetical protein
MAKAAKTTPTPQAGDMTLADVARTPDRVAFAKLMSKSDGLPRPPATFDAGAQYRVRLSKPVGHLRPASDVVVSGAYAETLRDAITGAVKL